MTERRWIADEIHGATAALTGPNAVHLAKVLRAQAGQQFEVVAGGEVRRGIVKFVAPERVEFALLEVLPAAQEQPLTALISVFKFDRFEWAIEKAAELGVSSIHPVIARRTEIHLAQAAENRWRRWQKILHEAAQQSRRLSVPQLHAPVKVNQALLAGEKGILLSEIERNTSLVQALQKLDSTQGISLAFGPEGGWTANEVARFNQAGWVSASLGNHVLRAETAIIAALAVVQAWRAV